MLILIRGPAAAGKSEAAKLLQKRLGKKTALIEMDKLYYEVLQNDIDHEMVLECAAKMADTFMAKGYDVIVEGVLTVPYDKNKEKLRLEKLTRSAKKHKTECKIFFFDVELPVALARDKERYGKTRAFVKKLHRKTRDRKHPDEIRIDVSELSVKQTVNRIIKSLSQSA